MNRNANRNSTLSALAGICLWLGAAGGALAAGPWYVATNGSGADGLSWSTAYTNLQQAIDAAAGGDTIYIAGHTFSNKTAVQLCSQLVWTNKGLSILGGYAADGGTPGAMGSTPTILTGPTSPTNRIFYISGVTNGLLQRVTITGGQPGSSSAGIQGAGAYITACSNLALTTCAIIGNYNNTYSGDQRGGGLYVLNSVMSLTNCIVSSNTVWGTGWGGYGGGIYMVGSVLFLTNCVVARNLTSQVGIGGGGIRMDSGALTIVDSVIAGNTIIGSTPKGGGISVIGGALTVRNGLIYGNTSTSTGYGLCVEGGSAVLNNCTVASHPGDAVNRTGGTLAVTNSILWGNVDDVVGTVTLAYTDVRDGDNNGTNGCFSSDPQFQCGYYLTPGSSCVETGNVTAAAAGLSGRTTRTDGTADTGTVDLGYHYATGFDVTYADIYVAANGDDSLNNGTNALSPFKTITKAILTARDGTQIHIAAGNYATNTETFPLTIDGKIGVRLLGTNSSSTIINASGANQRVLTLNYADGVTRIEGLTLTGGLQGKGAVNGYGPGGGVYVYAGSDVTLSSCMISNNVCNAGPSQYGGGLYTERSILTVTNCAVERNTITATGWASYGGGISLISGVLTVRDSVIDKNSMSLNYSGYGGGVYASGGTLSLLDSLVYGNFAATEGYGCYVSGGAANVANCTIASHIGQGLRITGGTVAVTNSILWGNFDDLAGSAALGYCDIQDGDNNGTNGCFSADPQFQSGYYLGAGTPCVNTGSVSAATAGVNGRTTRVDGTPDTNAKVNLGYHYAAGLDQTYADIYVATNGNDTLNSGTSLLSPIKTITKALTWAQDGTRIHIAAGNYTTNTETFPLSLSSRNGVQLLGTNRDTTVLNATGAVQRVLNLLDLNGPTRVEGFTITGGQVTPVGAAGGGLYANNCPNLTIASCIVTNNRATPGSQSSAYGGGIYANQSGMTLTNCILVANTSSANAYGNGKGGGLYAVNGNLTIMNSTVARNVTTDGNTPSAYGGGICVDSRYLVVQNSLIVSNSVSSSSSPGYGGGIYMGGTMGQVRNCLISANDANRGVSSQPGYGDGLYAGSSMDIESSTISANAGEGLNRGAGTVAVTNSILWANGVDATGTVALAWSDVGVWDPAATRANCISTDPLFRFAATNDYRLLLKSSCVNAGTNLAWMTNALDLAGTLRIQNKQVDMGAYETAVPSGGMAIMFR